VSVAASSWAWEQQLNPTTKFVLVALADFADAQGENCYPGQDTLARMTGLTQRSISSALVKLRDCGLVEVHERWARGHRTTNGYRLVCDRDRLSYNAGKPERGSGMKSKVKAERPSAIKPERVSGMKPDKPEADASIPERGSSMKPERGSGMRDRINLSDPSVIDPSEDPIRHGHRQAATGDGVIENSRLTSAPPPTQNSLAISDIRESSFARFWMAYPRREHRIDARKAWFKLDERERCAALDDVPRRMAANWRDRDIAKIPHASTYLHQRLWLDDLQDLSASLPSSGPRRPRLRESQRDLAQEIAELREQGR